MPHFDFDAARRAYEVEWDPVTFTYAGEVFEVLPEPSLGDTFDLRDAPDVDLTDDFDPDNALHIELVDVLRRFVRRMIPEADRERWDRAHYRVPASQAGVIAQIANYIAENRIAARPTKPSEISSAGPPPNGPGSNENSDGNTPSSAAPLESLTPCSTTS